MPNPLEPVVRVLNEMVTDGVLVDYAIGGAVAAIFWGEPIDTSDLDVFVVVPGSGVLVSLGPLYAWLVERGYELEEDHVYIENMPVQFLAAPPGLGDEAIEEAETVKVGRTHAWIVTPEYLIAMWLSGSAASPKRKARAAAMVESGLADRKKLRSVLAKYGIPTRGVL